MEETPEQKRNRLRANSRRWYARHRDAERARSAAKQKANPAAARRRTQRWRVRNPKKNRDQQRAAWLRWKYEISVADYDRLVQAQNGRCGICGTSTPGGYHDTYWRIDHCHKTGRIRGLLCDKCNRGGGQFGDDPTLLRAAADWFERSS